MVHGDAAAAACVERHEAWAQAGMALQAPAPGQAQGPMTGVMQGALGQQGPFVIASPGALQTAMESMGATPNAQRRDARSDQRKARDEDVKKLSPNEAAFKALVRSLRDEEDAGLRASMIEMRCSDGQWAEHLCQLAAAERAGLKFPRSEEKAVLAAYYEGRYKLCELYPYLWKL